MACQDRAGHGRTEKGNIGRGEAWYGTGAGAYADSAQDRAGTLAGVETGTVHGHGQEKGRGRGSDSGRGRDGLSWTGLCLAGQGRAGQGRAGKGQGK